MGCTPLYDLPSNDFTKITIYFPKGVMKNFECAFRNGSVDHYEETRSLNFRFLGIYIKANFQIKITRHSTQKISRVHTLIQLHTNLHGR